MRLTFNYLAKVARDHGFVFEQNGNSRYVLFSNKLAPGIESEYSSIAEAWDEVGCLLEGINPLDSRIPLPKVNNPKAMHLSPAADYVI